MVVSETVIYETYFLICYIRLYKPRDECNPWDEVATVTQNSEKISINLMQSAYNTSEI